MINAELTTMEDELGIMEDKNELVETPDDHSSFSGDQGEPEGDIDGLSNYNLILNYPELDFSAMDLLTFQDEVKDWFGAGDIKIVSLLAQISDSMHDLPTLKKILDNPSKTQNGSTLLKCLIQLAYRVLGKFGQREGIIATEEELAQRMISQCYEIVNVPGLVLSLCNILKTKAQQLSDISNFELGHLTTQQLELRSLHFFYSMTILNTILLAFNTRDESRFENERKMLIKDIDDAGIIFELLKSIDQWKWSSSKLESLETVSILETITSHDIKHKSGKFSIKLLTSFKIRNVILLLNNLILITFGDSKHLESTEEFLKFKYETDANSDGNSNEDYTISSMDYEYYKNELLTRYPTFTPKKYETSEIIELTAKQADDNYNNLDDEDETFDDSISNILNINSLLINQHQHLRNSKQVNGLFLNNDPPDIHIATPMPSPTLTPQHTGNSRNYQKVSELKHPTSEVKKKLFITQAHFPNVCPHDDEPPKSIKDATDLFYHHIKDDFNTQQFIQTFEQFIEKEHGTLGTFNDKFQYSAEEVKINPMFEDEIKSLERVELFYAKAIPYFKSLIYVLLQTLISNIIPTQQTREDGQTRHRQVFTTSEENYERPYTCGNLGIFEKQKLEINRMKETMLKSTSSILILLQKWFKLSHILKFEYFTSLLYDQDFLIHLFRYLDSNKIQSQFNGGSNPQNEYSFLPNRIVYCDYMILYHLEDYDIFKKILKFNNKSYKIPLTPDKDYQINKIFTKRKKDGNIDEQQFSFFLPFVPRISFDINKPNIRSCILMANLFNSMNHIVSNYKLQRIYKLLDVRPTEILRFYLTLHNKQFYQPILSTIKVISPFTGKKWRSNNMDLISFVYLFNKIEIKDMWLNNLVNSSMEDKINKSFDNEFALRCLIKFYNFEKYGNESNEVQINEFMNEVDKFGGDFFLKGCFELNN